MKKYHIIVVGAGHAGCEAALAASRRGFKTLLITQHLDAIAQMSCNPAIGGIAKGQIVREIDALGGEMAWVTDTAGLQFRMLNMSRGAAVWSPRAQCDKKLYHLLMKASLEKAKNLDILQGEVIRILVEGNRTTGVELKIGTTLFADAVIITAGTFLRGLIHVGLTHFPGGRFGEFPADSLSTSLAELGFEIKRLKTGTPPRINGNSVDYTKMQEQPGDVPPIPFSHFTDIKTWQATRRQLSCWLTYTNETTHDVIRANIDRSPLYAGIIKSVGPRYCPSIEDKVVRFADRTRHQVFLEPEGFNTNELYVNGISTSLPADVQENIVHSIEGLENAVIMRYGYAIEYDFFPPTQLKPSLETKIIDNLYFAGQINGTTGYEEAAAQGLIAGINASLKLAGEQPLILARDEAYIGVMIDDLITKGVDEPYRMFTSRAEYRLTLRSGNADRRLIGHGYKIGLISDTMYRQFCAYRDAVAKRIAGGDLPSPAELSPWTPEQVDAEVHIEQKYAGYIQRQKQQAAKLHSMESRHIPADFDYDKIPSLLTEARQKFKSIRPATLGQAQRIQGISPSDIAVIMIYLEKMKGKKNHD
ncbi:MAG: tRNA uridine-5-carboxymethylaminomethyl(34) synthesis enzyme MnmG [Endomicrobiales bacterium]|jgi:tRNA uridine 5-carboxymethylaminomethyl modification enzyme